MATSTPAAPPRSPLRFALFAWFTALVTGPTFRLIFLGYHAEGWRGLDAGGLYVFTVFISTAVSLLPFLGFLALTERVFRRVASPGRIRLILSGAAWTGTVALFCFWLDPVAWWSAEWWGLVACYTLPLWASIWTMPLQLGPISPQK